MAQQGLPRIGLLGGECTGKSTLADDLAYALGGCVVHEVVRDFVAEHGRPPRPDEQPGILLAQARREDEAAGACPGEVLVADPAPLMTAVYSLVYFGDPGLVEAGVEHARGYDLLVWCAPDPVWAPDDGQRDGPDMRAAADGILEQLAADVLAPAGIPVLRVHGDREARVTAVRLAWQPGASRRPT